MDRTELYDVMAARKSAPKDFGTYIGDNGRVNRCARMMQQGQINHGGKLLDIGGGIGDLAHLVVQQKKLFDSAVVLDISKKNLEAAASKGCTGILADVDKQGIPVVEQFNVITALDFIEHIIDPENFARECYRCLKTGGEVFINTPNIQYWEHIEHLVHGRFPHTSGDREVYHGGHLAFFTYLDLCEIFENAGFVECKQLKDDDGFRQPPATFNATFMEPPKTQNEYVEWSMRFGNPNLLFRATKR